MLPPVVTEEERREGQNLATHHREQQQVKETGEEGERKGNVLRAVLCLLPELGQQELRAVCDAAGKMMTEL